MTISYAVLTEWIRYLLSGYRFLPAICVFGLFSQLVLAGPREPLSITLDPSRPGQWRCPTGQDCTARPDYLSYVLGSPHISLYLSFSGELRAPLSPRELQRHFRYLDLYLRADERGERWKLLGASADRPGEGSVRFEQLDARWMRLRLQTRSYRLRTEKRSPDVCLPNASRESCAGEQRIDEPVEVELIVPMSALPPIAQRTGAP